MARRPDELPGQVVVEIEDEYSRLTADEQVRRTQAWFDSLVTDEPIDLGVSAAALLAAVRADEE